MSFWDMAMLKNNAPPLDLDLFAILLHLEQGGVITQTNIQELLGFDDPTVLSELDEFMTVLPGNGVEYSMAVFRGARLHMFELDTVAEVRAALGITP